MDNGSKHDAETTQDYLKAKITLSGQVSLIPTEHSMKTENKTDCRRPTNNQAPQAAPIKPSRASHGRKHSI